MIMEHNTDPKVKSALNALEGVFAPAAKRQAEPAPVKPPSTPPQTLAIPESTVTLRAAPPSPAPVSAAPPPAIERPAPPPAPPPTPSALVTGPMGHLTRKPLELPDPDVPAAAPAAPAAPAPAPAGPRSAAAQVRRVAYLFPATRACLMTEFMEAVDAAAAKLSKKPLVLERVFVLVLQGSEGAESLAVRARVGGAVAAILASDDAADLRRLKDSFEGQGLQLRAVPPEGAARRPAIIDLLVDLMLLGG